MRWKKWSRFSETIQQKHIYAMVSCKEKYSSQTIRHVFSHKVKPRVWRYRYIILRMLYKLHFDWTLEVWESDIHNVTLQGPWLWGRPATTMTVIWSGALTLVCIVQQHCVGESLISEYRSQSIPETRPFSDRPNSQTHALYGLTSDPLPPAGQGSINISPWLELRQCLVKSCDWQLKLNSLYCVTNDI
jgi:hypothetical protein